MKFPFALLVALATRFFLHAQVLPASPSPVGALNARPAAAAPSPGKKPPPVKTDEPAAIEGIEVARPAGGFLGVQIVNGTFKISFYDAKRKPVAADVVRAALWWDPKYKVGKERVVLNLAEDGHSLTSPRVIRPPYHFKLFITLIKEPTDAPEPTGETHVIDFRA